jgi:hypothetical protein
MKALFLLLFSGLKWGKLATSGGSMLPALMLYRPSPMLLIVAILAAPELVKAWRYDPKAPENVAYYGC